MQDPQSGSQVVYADAVVHRLPIGRQARAVVINAEAKIAIAARTGDADDSSGHALGNTVLDGIFHQWLQQEVWHQRLR